MGGGRGGISLLLGMKVADCQPPTALKLNMPVWLDKKTHCAKLGSIVRGY